MNKILAFAVLISVAFNNYAQTPTFKWINGTDTFNTKALYGTKGIPASGNMPGSRQNSVTWTDSNNNLWLFGGNGYSTTSTAGFLCDLWKYDVSLSQWTWVSGSDSTNKHGVYGTITIAASGNFPGARQNSVTWIDATGNLWLFGGNGYAIGGALTYLNDLWKYDITTNLWTWMSGSKTGAPTSVYGTKGVASASNVPGGRYGSSAWADNNNNLWLLGGQQNTGTVSRLNDLWKYNISSGQWTWMSGSNLSNQNGVYGTKGISSSANTPGARQASVCWKDNNGNFWLFGGDGFAKSNTTNLYMDDLWKYDVSLNEWTWVHGTDTVSQPAVYGTKGVASASNIPGARQMSIGWRDLAGDIWMFGGWGYVGPPFGRMNDLWRYNISLNQWTWIGGANSISQPGVYGTKGVAATTNIPGARRMSVSWTDSNGKFWLLGGTGYDKRDSLGLLNDLWQIDVGAVAGIERNYKESNSFKVYPSPSQTEIAIEFGDFETHDVQLMDVFGKIILTWNVSTKRRIDISSLSSGTYFIRCEDEIKKLIKN